MTPREHIKNLSNDWLDLGAKQGRMTATLLDEVVTAIFGEPIRLGFELLQNAEDAAIVDENIPPQVDYFLLEKYLVVRHNGRHFSSDDIDALCDYGRSSEKKLDIQKIGYKGIGFKSVFNLAKRVWIWSQNYRFRFDQEHWQERLPWQIMPVWSEKEDFPPESSIMLEDGWVTFILELTDPTLRRQYRDQFRKLFADEQIILFLRNLHTVNFFVQNLQTGEIEHDRCIQRTVKDNLIGLHLSQNGEIKKQTQWLVRYFQVKIPEDVRQSIQEEDKRVCPDKLKQATFIEIGLAAKVSLDKGVLIPLQDRVPIYNYLPTEHYHNKFTYLVNSNFLMDAGRGEIFEKKWNFFLFEEIGYLQFEWFREMHTDERFRFDFTDLIVRYAENNQRDPFRASINLGVTRAINEIAFVPVLPNEEKNNPDDDWLRRTAETIVDKTHISDYEEERQTVRMAFEKPLEIADPAIKNIDRLISFGANAFDHHKLANVIRTTGRFRQPETNARLVNFLYDRIAVLADHDRAQWNKELFQTPFLLTIDTSMLEPREVYLERLTEQLPFTADLPILHPVVNRLTVMERKEVENWLIELKASYPKPLDIIRKTVFNLIRKDEITLENTIPILRYVFSHYALLEESDYKELTGLKIRTQRNSLLLPRQCHLADCYEPGLPLEQVLEEDIFVHEGYPEDENTLPNWKRFFVRLGVKQEMDIIEYKGFYNAGDLRKKGFGDYIDYLLNEELPPFNRNANHGVHHFVSVDFYKYLNNPTFARSFWQILLEQKWQSFRAAARKCQFYHSAGKVPASTYFQYFVSRHPSFLATDGLCYPTEEIYSKSLESVIKNLLPVSYFEMTLDQEEIFGLRSDLTAEDYLELIEKLTCEDSGAIDISHFESIYRFLASSRFNETEQLLFRKWAESHTLPATDGTLRPIPVLYYLDIPQHARRSNATRTIWLPGDSTVALALTGLFGIPVIKETDLVLEEGHCVSDSALRAFIAGKLPWFATIKASRIQREWQGVCQEMQEQIDTIEILKSNELKLVFWSGNDLVYEKKVWSWTTHTTLYYVEPYEDNLTRIALVESIARMLSIEDSLKEIDIILSLDNDQLQIWAENEGFEVPKVKNKEYSDFKEPTLSTVSEGRSKYQANINTDDPILGRQGEAYIFQYLKSEFPDDEVVWHNEVEESSLPYDFSIRNGNEDRYFIEVKTTGRDDKKRILLSAPEFHFLLKNTEKYLLYRVSCNGPICTLAKILRWEDRFIWDGYEIEIKRI